jgi:predicted metal-dependent peptidase
MSLMTWTCPGFQHLFYKLLAPERNGKYHAVMSAGIPIAATDATSIILNPARFFKYNLSERAFIIAHEVGHNMYADVEYIQHCSKTGLVPMEDGTTLPFNNDIMQQALDFRLNALLVESKIGELPRPIDDYHLCYDTKIAKANDSRTDVYKKLFKKYEQEGKIKYIP